MYITYSEYVALGGTLDEDRFISLQFGAEALVDYVTFNRLQNDTEFTGRVKYLMKYLIDLEARKEAALSRGSGDSSSSDPAIVSQSNDGVSVTYSSIAPEELFEICKNDALRAAQTYLSGAENQAGQKLLYRGLYSGE